jgi:hypothetical protein
MNVARFSVVVVVPCWATAFAQASSWLRQNEQEPTKPEIGTNANNYLAKKREGLSHNSKEEMPLTQNLAMKVLSWRLRKFHRQRIANRYNKISVIQPLSH